MRYDYYDTSCVICIIDIVKRMQCSGGYFVPDVLILFLALYDFTVLVSHDSVTASSLDLSEFLLLCPSDQQRVPTEG